MKITGECFCGEIKYEIDGSLRDARSCHCSCCRKAFSSQASAYALVEHQEFKWLSGESLLTSYIGSHGFGLQFCSKCGSTLCGIYNETIDGITLGCVNGDPNIELSKHIFVGSKPVGKPSLKAFLSTKKAHLKMHNRVRAGFSPAFPAPPYMRIRIRRLA